MQSMRAGPLGVLVLLRSHPWREPNRICSSVRPSVRPSVSATKIQFNRGAQQRAAIDEAFYFSASPMMPPSLGVVVVVFSSPPQPPPMLQESRKAERQSLAGELLTFKHEHNHKGDNESQAAVFLHQNGKSDYVAQADRVAGGAPCFARIVGRRRRGLKGLIQLDSPKARDGISAAKRERERGAKNSPRDGQKVLQF